MKSWFAIDGGLKPIPIEGSIHECFPEELAEIVIQKFSKVGDWVLDPFVGFGTTVVAAQKQGRNAVGVEKDRERYEFAQSRCVSPSKIIHDDISNILNHKLPQFDLLFASPPYGSFRDPNTVDLLNYFKDFERIFASFKPLMKPNATIVIEISNTRVDGVVRPIVWDCAKILAKHYKFMGEMIRCNTGTEMAGPGFDHSYLLIYK